MQPPSGTITDIWFHSPLSLLEMAQFLGLCNVSFDSENHWAWAVGTLDRIELDVTRTHTRPPVSVPTRIFRPDKQPFSPEQRAELIARLLRVVDGPISCGRWIYRQGNDFDQQVVERVGSEPLDRDAVIRYLRGLPAKALAELFYAATEGKHPWPEEQGWSDGRCILAVASRDKEEAGANWKVSIVCPATDPEWDDDAPLCQEGQHCGLSTISWAKDSVCPMCHGDVRGS